MTQPKTIRSATRITKWIQFQRDQRKKQEKNPQLLHMRSQDYERQNARLEAQRSYWKGVVEGIADEVWVCDMQGRMSLINLPEVTQMGLKEFQDLTIHEVMEIVEILNPDGQPRPLEEAPLLRSLQGEIVRGEEIMRDRRSGRQRYRQYSSAPTRDDRGAITGAVAVLRDITEQKQMEEALRDSEARFRALVSASAQVLYQMSPDWSEMRQLRGGSFLADTIVPNREWLNEYIHPEDQAWVLQVIEKAVRTGEVFELEHRVLRADGNLGWTASRAVPVRNEKGEIVEWFGAASDITYRKWAEEALRASEERFNKAFQSAPNSLVISRMADGRIEIVNDSFVKLFGYSQTEVMGKTSLELHMFADPTQREELIARLRAHGSLRNVETDIRVRSGEIRRASLSIERIRVFNEDYLLTILEDITERKRMEQALRDSQQKTREILESISDGFFALDRDWRFNYVNQRAAQNGGLEPEELIGVNIWEQYPFLLKTELEQQYRHVMANREPAHLEFQGALTDQWYSVSVYPTSDGISIYWLDISERKQAEEALRTANRTLQEQTRMLDLVHVLVRDLDSRIIFWNQGAEDLYGFTKEEALGRVSHQLLQTKFPNSLGEVEQSLLQQRAWEGELVHTRRDGTEVYVASHWVLYQDEAGQPAAIIEVNNDISGQKQAEQALAAANTHLEQRVNERTNELEQALEKEKILRQQLIQAEKYEALSRLIASVAHEMNNPLQTVQNSLFLLRNAIPAGKPQDLMEMAISESQRMGNLVNQLRETYRPSSFQAVDFNLVEVIRQVYGLLAPQLRQNNILWQMSCEGENLLVHGVPDQLKQVFLNICLNAVDAMEGQGGKIQVCVTPPDGREEACVSIQDSGPGIPEQHLAKVFEPFFTTKEKGTGLGLAISYEIIKDHGGTIVAESQPGEGATFQVCLPLLRE